VAGFVHDFPAMLNAYYKVRGKGNGETIQREID
jgi:hypothetical protein